MKIVTELNIRAAVLITFLTVSSDARVFCDADVLSHLQLKQQTDINKIAEFTPYNTDGNKEQRIYIYHSVDRKTSNQKFSATITDTNCNIISMEFYNDVNSRFQLDKQ